MEKTIKINGKDLALNAKALNLIVYESQFGEDALPNLGKWADAMMGKIAFWEIGALNIAKLTWAMAKTKDPNFPDFEKWFGEMEGFPAIDVYTQTREMVQVNLISNSDVKPKKETRAEN